MTAFLGVDVGGTFTDAVLVADGRLRTAKVPTSARQEESVVAAARAVGAPMSSASRTGRRLRRTHCSSARARGPRSSPQTASSTCCISVARRAHLYRLCVDHPEPLVPLERCVGVRERMGPDGVLAPLELESIPALDADAVAVCLLHSYRWPEHERAVAAELRRRLPHAHVVASHEVAPEFREYERASTTAADAYLGPVVARYLRALGTAAGAPGCRSRS